MLKIEHTYEQGVYLDAVNWDNKYEIVVVRVVKCGRMAGEEDGHNDDEDWTEDVLLFVFIRQEDWCWRLKMLMKVFILMD